MNRLVIMMAAFVVSTAEPNVAQADDFTTITYGGYPTSFGELTIPKGDGPFPVIVTVHGSCWRSDSTSTTARYRPHAKFLSDHGVATWNIGHRRVGHEGGGWPGTFLDLGSALDYLDVISKSHPIDLDRVIALGHSSGGHFVAWLASRPLLPKDSDIRGDPKVSLAGVVISDAFIDPMVIDSHGVDGRIYCRDPLLEKYIGGTPETHPQRLRQISPLQWLPWGIPQEYVVSTYRYPVTPPRPLAQGKTTMVMPDYPALARKAGDSINVVIVPDADHRAFYEPGIESYDKVLEAVLRMVEKTE
jgi:acetyl esterase/lipase